MWIGLEDLGKENVLIREYRGGPWRESSWREILRGEILSVEKPLQGEMVFKERISLWRDSSRREKLRGEPVREVAI
jgi:hypothetical protein